MYAHDNAVAQTAIRDDVRGLRGSVPPKPGPPASTNASNRQSHSQCVLREVNTAQITAGKEVGEAETAAFRHNGAVLFESSQMTAVSAVGIKVASFSRAPCTPWCSCVCHTESRLRSPRFLDSVLGALFVGYAGLPGGKVDMQ